METENGADKQEYNHAVEQYQHDEEAKDQAEMVALLRMFPGLDMF